MVETTLDLLEQRVSLMVARFAALRADVARLERELLASPSSQEPSPPSAVIAPETLAGENSRLLAERAAVLERVRLLIGEIDRAL